MKFPKKRKSSFASSRFFVATSFLLSFCDDVSATSRGYQPHFSASFAVKSKSGLSKNRDALAFVSMYPLDRRNLLGRGNFIQVGRPEQIHMNSPRQDHEYESSLRINGDINGDNSLNLTEGVNGSKNEDSLDMLSSPVEDDDYAMSIPKPLQITNGEGNLQEELTSSVDQENVLNGEEELQSRESKDAESISVQENITSNGTDADQQSSIGTLIRNFWASKDNDRSPDGDDRSEESRRWSEWMTAGKIVRPSTSSDTAVSDEATKTVDEGVSSTEKVESPTVVSVSAEAADGVAASSTMFAKMKQQSRKNKTGIEQKQQQKRQEKEAKQQLEQKQKQREEKHYREQRDRDPGRISAVDWSHNMFNILNSRILRDVKNPVFFACLWATFWSVAYKSLITIGSSPNKRVADLALRCASTMTMPTTAHSMMVSAMSLLLVFRTNSAYQRYAEGRKIWEDIVSTSRDFSRMVKLYEFAIGTSKCRRIRLLIASFPYLLRHRIRPSLLQLKKVNDPSFVRDPDNSLLLYPDVAMKDTDPEIAALAYDEEETGVSRRKTRELCWVDKRTLPWKLLPGTALDLCARAQNRPLWVVDRMAKELCVVEDMPPLFTNRERMALLAYTDKLSRSIGGCERIHQTVVPLNYARHALRSVTVWLWTLPFALIKDLGLLTGPIVAIIAWILFGVYEIGTRIEDPFQGTLRLSIYCDSIRRDVLADAIVRDTAFDLDGDGRITGDIDGDEDAIFEFESESDEYGEGDGPPKRKKVKAEKSYGFRSITSMVQNRD
ncbi:hypothetical protein HJC23_012000 [Cyclotella cryptica]|uniref:Bestrophin homolog n=1 Tax=Cyclotella cryptica TaxID=29204 RepID=A0ABD3QUI6_9STRA|eukprot:CCRYP_003069-RB/>CCRYP_003069-RB protein AED:0.02 eAED:0.02 QI:457/1/1/1/0.66/0.5/4/2240/778